MTQPILFILAVILNNCPAMEAWATPTSQSKSNSTEEAAVEVIDENFPQNRMALSDQETACFETDVALVGEEKDIILEFTVQGSQECWRYCRVLAQCSAIAFHIETGRCSLFKKYEARPMENHERISNVILTKFCTERKTGLKEERALNLSREERGVLIMQGHDWMTMRCLTARVPPDQDRLQWGVCNRADSWLIRPEKVGTRGTYQIALAKDPGQCIDVKFHDFTGSVFLRK